MIILSLKSTILSLKSPKGGTVLVSMIIISAIIFTISLSLGLSSISENQIIIDQTFAQKSFFNTTGCAEEALISLNRNNIYQGESISLGGTNCVIAVSGTGNSRLIDITSINNNYSNNFQINVTLYPVFSITSWVES